MRHYVRINGETKSHGLWFEKYFAGQKVTFEMLAAMDVSISVHSDDVERIDREYSEKKGMYYFSFRMPNKDVNITVSTRCDMMAPEQPMPEISPEMDMAKAQQMLQEQVETANNPDNM